MKLRIYRDNIRLRLTPSDVHQLMTSRSLMETTHFPTSTFAYICRLTADVAQPTAKFEANQITVDLPLAAAQRWADSPDATLAGSQPIENGRTLQILIEKDFECLLPGKDEPGVELYPNPRKTQTV